MADLERIERVKGLVSKGALHQIEAQKAARSQADFQVECWQYKFDYGLDLATNIDVNAELLRLQAEIKKEEAQKADLARKVEELDRAAKIEAEAKALIAAREEKKEGV